MSDTAEQATHHYVLTVQKPLPQGLAVHTIHGTCILAAGATRKDVYEQVRAEFDQTTPELMGGNVLFWSLEPNQL